MSVANRTTYAVTRRGEPVCIRRQGQSDINTMAVIRTLDGADLVGSIQQNDRKAIMGAADILASGWPDLPKRGDSLIVQGRVTAVQFVAPFYTGGELVRIEVTVRG